MHQSNIFNVNQYAYSDSSVMETRITKFDDIFGKTHMNEERQYETVKNKKSLISRTYLIKEETKSLSGRYEYSFY
ncbi:MAG: hypothetical protein E6H08_15210 [Bacteroidetes bacterium]|nr:MAG: hypothetical protein E6H08_15210 [Bacteroidota bacterium]